MVEHQQPTPGEHSERLSKAETLQRLRETIQRLEEIADTLSAKPESELPPSITSLVDSTETLAAVLKPEAAVVEPNLASATEEQAEPASSATAAEAPEPEEAAVGPTAADSNSAESATDATVAEASQPVSPPFVNPALPEGERLDRWDELLNKIRALLPTSFTQKLSYWRLTAILAGAVIAVLLSSVLLFPKGGPETTGDKPPAIDIKTPPALEAPTAEQPLETIASPEPELKLTPEQSLIAAIQAQVAQITSQYAQGLIQTLEANFADSRLIVKVGDDWYALEDTRQDQLANEMLRRSQELDFRKLEITDSQNALLARSPVVGSEMVILNRRP
ncbi:MAG: hypothetical protein ACFB4I_06455 [Cyanophyceae cyanobacterium]